MGKHHSVIIDGGFFWLADDPNAPGIVVNTDDVLINGCRFSPRPKKWWHLREWYRVWRLFLTLPEPQHKGPAESGSTEFGPEGRRVV